MTTEHNKHSDLTSRILEIYFVVWGKEYLDLLLDIALPSYLSENNLVAIAKKNPIIISIFTNTHGKKYIENHPTCLKIQKLGKLEINCSLDQIDTSLDKLKISSLLHEAVIHQMLKRDSINVIACPDIIIGDGSLSYAFEKALKGHKLITYPYCIRIQREHVAPILKAKIRQGHTFLNEELIELGLSHLHEYTQSHCLGVPNFNKWTSSLLYPIDAKTYFAHTFFFHPYMLDVRGKNLKYSIRNSLIDGDVFDALGFKPKDIYVIEDTLQFGSLELAPKNQPVTETAHYPYFRKIRQLYKVAAFGLQRALPSYHLPVYTRHRFIFRCSQQPIPINIRMKYYITVFPLLLLFRSRYYLTFLKPKNLAKSLLSFLGIDPPYRAKLKTVLNMSHIFNKI